MKWTSLSLAVLALCCAVLRADDVTFTQGLSLEDMHRAGLDKLTPQEREALDLLVAGKKTVVREIVRTVTVDSGSAGSISSSSSTTSVTPAADPTPASVAARATESTSAADAGGWLHWLHGTPPDKTKEKKKLSADEEAASVQIKSTLVGKFRGWGKTTVFHLANGQAWVVSDYSERQFVESVDNPEVSITSAGIFGFVLQMPGNDEVYIRVRPAN